MEIAVVDPPARPADGRRAEARRRLRRLRRRRDPFRRAYDIYAKFYDQLFGPALHDGRVRAIRLLDPRPGERVLEIGVGTGLTFGHYPPAVRLEAIDMAEKMLPVAPRRRDRLGRRGRAPRAGIVAMDAGRLAYPSGRFDAVVAAYVLTAVARPRAVLAEVRRILRPGGRLVVVNRVRSRHPIVRRAEETFSGLFEAVGFSVDVDIEGLLRAAGFRVVRAERVNGFGRFRALVAIRS